VNFPSVSNFYPFTFEVGGPERLWTSTFRAASLLNLMWEASCLCGGRRGRTSQKSELVYQLFFVDESKSDGHSWPILALRFSDFTVKVNELKGAPNHQFTLTLGSV
jgi:hypothetical protein